MPPCPPCAPCSMVLRFQRRANKATPACRVGSRALAVDHWIFIPSVHGNLRCGYLARPAPIDNNNVMKYLVGPESSSRQWQDDNLSAGRWRPGLNGWVARYKYMYCVLCIYVCACHTKYHSTMGRLCCRLVVRWRYSFGMGGTGMREEAATSALSPP